jgi:hypothetical protein
VQTPPAQTSPPVQSVLEAHGQGPLVPPHVMHSFCQHSCEAPVHWVVIVQAHAGWPAPPQGVHWFETHVLPAAQSEGMEHVLASAAASAEASEEASDEASTAASCDASLGIAASGSVDASVVGPTSIPVPASAGAGPTCEQPYPSHW